eukprot:8003135-Alexandrium_andersonii.AAC.1
MWFKAPETRRRAEVAFAYYESRHHPAIAQQGLSTPQGGVSRGNRITWGRSGTCSPVSPGVALCATTNGECAG